MKSIYRLTDLDLRLAEAGKLLHDGDGLYFKRSRRSRPGTGSCLLRYWLHGRDRWMGLGRYPKVSLAAARKKAREYRTLIQDGSDPIDERRIRRVQKRRKANRNIVFKDCAEEYIALRFSGDGFKDPEKAAARMRDALKRHVYPIIGSLPVKLVDTDLVIDVLQPIWNTKRETADMVRAWIEDVLRFAKARRYRKGGNPAAFDNVEPNMAKRSKKKVKHYASLHYEGIGEFWVHLGSRSSVSALALKLLILTAARPGEVVGARWIEFDFEKKIWTIPAERTKTEESHIIPLSDHAIRLLKEIMKFAEGEFVFPGRKAGKHLTLAALEDALLRMGRDFTPHGFRSSFRTWGTDCADYPHWLLEICLAHSVKAAKEAGVDPELWKAYQRGKALEKRRPIMEQWADFVVSSKLKPVRERDQITAAPQPLLETVPMDDMTAVGQGTGLSPQKRATLQPVLSRVGSVTPPYLNNTVSAISKPLPTTPNDNHSGFSQTNGEKAVVLAQIDQDHYEVRTDGGIEGVIAFRNGQTKWGWQFIPSQQGMRRSRKLYRHPESTLKGRFTVVSIITNSSLDDIANEPTETV